MTPGIYRNLSNADYHGGPGISKSGLDLIHQAPAHYHAAVTSTDERISTPAQMIGTAFHCLLLEPHEFVKNYCAPLSPRDVPDAIVERDALVAIAEKINAQIDSEMTRIGIIRKADDLIGLINQMNSARLPKLSTSGSKSELLARIHDEIGLDAAKDADSAAELKAVIVEANKTRPGHLSSSGSLDALAQTVRDAGVEITLLRDVIADYKTDHGHDFFIDTKSSMVEMANEIRANGVGVKLWSECKSEWEQNNGHRIILTESQFAQLKAMRDSVMRHPAAYALMTRVNNVVVDVKTTEDASPDGFAKSIANWRYHTQHPFYLDGLREAIRQGQVTDLPQGEAEVSAYWTDEQTGEICRCRPDFWRGYPENFVFLAVEKKAPYAVGVYLLDDASVQLGRAEYRQDLNMYAECKKLENWPAYSDFVQSISLPQWQFKKSEVKLESNV